MKIRSIEITNKYFTFFTTISFETCSTDTCIIC